MTKSDKEEWLYEIARDIAYESIEFKFTPKFKRESFIEKIKEDIRDTYIFEDEENIED